MIRTTILTSFLVLITLSASAQEKLSAQVYGGMMFPYNDFTQKDYVGYKPNLALGMGVGYQLGPYFRLRGDLASGILNGNNVNNYYETNIYEGQLGVDINVIRFFNKDYEGIKLNIQGGVGMMWYYARLYDRATSAKLVESPVRGERTMSPNAILSYGANLSLPITPKLDFNLGFNNRFVEDADWMDAQKSGDYTDSYGMAQVGLTFYLKSDKDPTKIEIDKKRYDDILASRDSLSEKVEKSEANSERVAELEMMNEEKATRIQQLESTLDTIKEKLASASVATVQRQTSTGAPADAEAILASEQYRIVVASLPTEVMAQRWISRSSLDKSQMVVAFIPDLNTYRVVYMSFDTFAAARKELLGVKAVVSDAWIAKF